MTVALPGPGPLVAELEARGARVVAPPHARAAQGGAAARRRRAAAGRRRPRAAARAALLRTAGRSGVYVNTTVLPWWLLLARLARRRVVCHVHEAEWPGPVALQRLLVADPLAADAVVANSRFTADVLTGLVPALAARTRVVPNPVPGPADVTPPGSGSTGRCACCSWAGCRRGRGPRWRSAALRELLARGIDARLTLAGSVFEGYEWFEAELRAPIRTAGLADRVELLGFRADVWPPLRAADVALVPSVLDESFGNTAVEAVLAARPVVGERPAAAPRGRGRVRRAPRPSTRPARAVGRRRGGRRRRLAGGVRAPPAVTPRGPVTARGRPASRAPSQASSRDGTAPRLGTRCRP